MDGDLALVQSAKQGDQDAFAQLVQLHQKKVYNLTLRMTGSPEDAEEMAQTAFWNAWRNLPSFREEASFSTWLYRLAVNACLDFLRKERHRRQGDSALSLDDTSNPASQVPDFRYAPEEDISRGELRRSIIEGLNLLSAEHRCILIMREIDGLSYQEIGQVLGLEAGTVKSRLARGRLALRRILAEQGNLPSVSTSDSMTAKGGVTP